MVVLLERGQGSSITRIGAATTHSEPFGDAGKSIPSIGAYPDGRDELRGRVIAAVNAMADQLDRFVGLDARWLYPLTYTVAGSKPDAARSPRPDPPE